MTRPLVASLLLLLSIAARAQSPAAGAPPDPDKPSFRVGTLFFADFTYQESPRTIDASGNRVNASSFNVTRAYINLFGNLNHWISFRITPDVARESSSSSTLSGSQEYRLKFAYAQFALDDWTTKGSWVRLGLQETPWIPFEESIYRYRFQGPVLVDRLGLLSASDNGVSGRYVLPRGLGEVQAGFFNGETFSKSETNDQKALQARVTIRPIKPLRLSVFADEDHYTADAKRQRVIGQVAYEHPRGTAAVEVVSASDRPNSSVAEVRQRAWSVWATPKLTTTGWELLLRHDETTPNRSASSQTQKRDIAGLAYWFQHLDKYSDKVACALMADYDSLHQSGFTPGRANDTRYGLKMLISF